MVTAGAASIPPSAAHDWAGRRFLLTGATGIVGSELLAQLLRRGAAVTVLIRDSASASAEARLQAVLAFGGVERCAGRVEIIRGELAALPQLSAGERGKLHGLSDVVHCAALTVFDPQRAEELARVNIEGALALLGAVAGTGAVFHHVSTSYVAGTFAQPFGEHMLDVGQSFLNPYERSKFEAERQLSERAEQLGVTLRIYRPSIVVGASDSGRIASFTSVYPFLRLSLSAFSHTVRIQGRPENPLNLVPVDWLAHAMLHLIQTAPAARVFHLTNPDPPNVAQITAWAYAYAPHCRVEIHPQLEQANRIERLLQRQLRHYAPYLSGSPTFDCRQTQALLPVALHCPRLLAEHYYRWLDYAAARDWRDLA